MNKILIILGFILFSSAYIMGQHNKVEGIWLTEEGDSKIKIYKAQNGKYYGQIIWLKKDENKKDTKNPDESKRNKPIKGLILMKGFEYDSSKEQWNKGTIYDPESGKTYSGFIWFENNSNELHLKGYILGMKIAGRSTVWQRSST